MNIQLMYYYYFDCLCLQTSMYPMLFKILCIKYIEPQIRLQ